VNDGPRWFQFVIGVLASVGAAMLVVLLISLVVDGLCRCP
jgi:hypothetical protein